MTNYEEQFTQALAAARARLEAGDYQKPAADPTPYQEEEVKKQPEATDAAVEETAVEEKIPAKTQEAGPAEPELTEPAIKVGETADPKKAAIICGLVSVAVAVIAALVKVFVSSDAQWWTTLSQYLPYFGFACGVFTVISSAIRIKKSGKGYEGLLLGVAAILISVLMDSIVYLF